jgi:hypothetical protein
MSRALVTRARDGMQEKETRVARLSMELLASTTLALSRSTTPCHIFGRKARRMCHLFGRGIARTASLVMVDPCRALAVLAAIRHEMTIAALFKGWFIGFGRAMTGIAD